jgi:hypothetical protein
VVERGQHLGFSLEARHPLRIPREGFRQYLERDLTMKLRVLGPKNLAHAAGAECGDNPIWAETIACLQAHRCNPVVKLTTTKKKQIMQSLSAHSTHFIVKDCQDARMVPPRQ